MNICLHTTPAIDIAEAWGARLTLMMCVKIDDEIAAFEQVSLSGYIPSELNAAAFEFLSELRQVVPSEIEVKLRVEVGEPAQEIVNAAQKIFIAAHCSKPVILAKGMPNDWDDDNNFVGGTNWKD